MTRDNVVEYTNPIVFFFSFVGGDSNWNALQNRLVSGAAFA